MIRSPLALLAIVLTVAVAGCRPKPPPFVGGQMTPQLVADKGHHVFPAPRAKVFAATIGALKTLGYQVAFSDEASGVIKTAPKELRSEAYTAGTHGPITYRGQAVTVTYARSYALRLSEQGTSTAVEATPRVFANGNDISSNPVWVLDGPTGEYLLWNQLFQEIASNLGSP
jgi:hypothetical protein